MKLELSAQEAELLKSLLSKDLDDAKVEMHHTKNIEFKSVLQERERLVQSLAARLRETQI